MKILILGGTSEATLLAKRLAACPDIEVVLSLAGRTTSPVLPPIPCRIGGFGGVAGLIGYLTDNHIEVVIDATHPFAERIAANARAACAVTKISLAVFTRPPWTRIDGDNWIEVETAEDAAKALGDTPKRVFLTVGRLQLAAFETAPQHDYVIRSIDPPGPLPKLSRFSIVLARGPFDLANELCLMRERQIEIVVTKNSGGTATYAKIEAARELGLPVVLMTQPPASDVTTLYNIEAVMAFLDA